MSLSPYRYTIFHLLCLRILLIDNLRPCHFIQDWVLWKGILMYNEKSDVGVEMSAVQSTGNQTDQDDTSATVVEQAKKRIWD